MAPVSYDPTKLDNNRGGTMNTIVTVRAAAATLGLAAALIAHAAEPTKGPAGWEATHHFSMGGVTAQGATTVILIHGLTSSARSWKNPMSASNMAKCDYDPKANMKTDAGLDIVTSPKAPRSSNYYDTLGKSFRVATWSQIPCMDGDHPDAACENSDTFDAAYQSAPWVLRKVLDETTGPIAIVGHSRGGLIGRRLLKEFGDAGGRIKWFVTLHTPHRGSGLSARAAAMNDVSAALIKALPKEVAGIIGDARDGVIAMAGNAGAEELGLSGSKSIFPALTRGEKQVPGIRYMSFGGNATTVLRLFVRAPGVGTDCGPSREVDAGLCYPRCAAGMKGVGPVCWQNCPSGYADHGVGCTKPAPYGRGAGYPWKFGDGLNNNGMLSRCRSANSQGCEMNGAIAYPRCRAGYHQVGCCVCSPDCPSGMTDTGATCTKKTATRGVGTSPSASFNLFSSTAIPELRNGSGDLMVTDASAHMPWPAPHVTQALHHGEVLWDVGTMQQVAAFLRQPPL
jgi:pimeloyl-ACP methyl ester carboxylesterase